MGNMGNECHMGNKYGVGNKCHMEINVVCGK